MWELYILECADGSYYTGITVNFQHRLARHNMGIASKYTRSRLPVKCLFRVTCFNEREARQLEARVKRLRRAGKEEFMHMEGKTWEWLRQREPRMVTVRR